MRKVELCAAEHRLGDATLLGRFVRHLSVEGPERLDLVTPPDRGSIAPRAARLPLLGEGVDVVEVPVWETVVDWITRGRRLTGCTIDDLSRMARIAAPLYAVEIGERAAHLAGDLVKEGFLGPMRGAGRLDTRRLLRPLEEAARESAQAADAYVAALARVALLSI
jgi:hypothetical protein